MKKWTTDDAILQDFALIHDVTRTQNAKNGPGYDVTRTKPPNFSDEHQKLQSLWWCTLSTFPSQEYMIQNDIT